MLTAQGAVARLQVEAGADVNHRQLEGGGRCGGASCIGRIAEEKTTGDDRAISLLAPVHLLEALSASG